MGNISLKSNFIPLSFIIIVIWVTSAFSASVTVIRPMSFGAIVASPTGDVIEIDARLGPDEDLRVLTPTNAIVRGGYSGIVRVVSDIAGQMINVIYPESVALTTDGFPDMMIDGIGSRSKTFAGSVTDEEVIDFHIGGLLHIVNVQNNAYYSGEMTLEVDVINP